MTGWWATLTDAERAALLAVLDPNEVFIHRGVSGGILSIARHYGGATVDCKRYKYIADSDELVRDDVLLLVEKMRKAQRKADRMAAKAAQGNLL